jgi:hypothetical protein
MSAFLRAVLLRPVRGVRVTRWPFRGFQTTARLRQADSFWGCLLGHPWCGLTEMASAARIKQRLGVWRPAASHVLDPQSLIRTEMFNSVWRALIIELSTRAQLDQLLEDAEVAVSRSVAAHQQYRRDRRHDWCNDPTPYARVFRYIRQGATAVASPPVSSALTQPGKANTLSVVDDWLWGFGPAPARALHTDQWLPALDGVPAFPAIGRLTGDTLRGIIKAAPRPRPRLFADIKRLPPAALDLLSLVLAAVEQTAEWPELVAHSLCPCCPRAVQAKFRTTAPSSSSACITPFGLRPDGAPFQEFVRAAGIMRPTVPKAADALANDLARRTAASIAEYPPPLLGLPWTGPSVMTTSSWTCWTLSASAMASRRCSRVPRYLPIGSRTQFSGGGVPSAARQPGWPPAVHGPQTCWPSSCMCTPLQ